MRGRAMPKRAGHRLLDQAEAGDAVLDQRDVDGELAVALDEFAGAVERIHQPEGPPPAAPGNVDGSGFLRQHRDVGRQCRQAVDDATMRSEVGSRQRRAIVLVLDRELAFIHREDRRGSLARDRDHRVALLRLQPHCCASHSRAMNSAAMLRPSEKSSRRISSPSASSFHGTTSSCSGSSPGSRCGYRSRASTRWVWWLM